MNETSPQAKASEVSETKKAEVPADEPSVSAQVCSESQLLLSDTNWSSLNKTDLNPFFQAQKVPINLLQAFQKHTLKKHLKCFWQWQKLRKSDLSEIARVIDIPEKRAIALNLEDHIHAMFPTESYSFATLMDDNSLVKWHGDL